MRLNTCAHAGLYAKLYPYNRLSVTRLREVSLSSLSDHDVAEAYREAVSRLQYPGMKSGIPVASWVQSLIKRPPMESTNRSNLRRPRARRGTRGFSAENRHKVKSCAAVLEREYGRRAIAFFTATLPASAASPSPVEWSYAVRLFRDALRDSLILQGLTPDIIGVIEIQEKRFRSTGDVCPHLHCAFPGKHPGQNWAISKDELRNMWAKSLKTAMPGIPDNEYFGSSTSVQSVKKSLVNYLGKYMSKGSKVIKEMKSQSKEHLIPTSWVMCSRSMHRKYKQSVRVVSGETARRILDAITSNPSRYVTWEKKIFVTGSDGGAFQVGWTASLTPSGVKKFLRMAGVPRIETGTPVKEDLGVMSATSELGTNVLPLSTEDSLNL